MIPVYVISLASSEARRAFMRDQLDCAGIEYKVVDAIDGRALDPDSLARAAPKGGVDYCGNLTPGEIGAALSHLAMIRQIAETDCRYVAVLEDDVRLSPQARVVLDGCFVESIPKFHLLQLSSEFGKPRLSLRVGCREGFDIHTSPERRFCMAGLIYSREGARLLSTALDKISAPIDNMVFHDRAPFGFRILEIRPSIVLPQEGMVSDIGSRPQPKGAFGIAKREVRRVRNRTRLWASFVRTWGLLSLGRLERLN